MFNFSIFTKPLISLLLFGIIPLYAQYSHFPITHLDWKLIDFEDPSISVISYVEEMDESSVPAIEDIPQVTLDSVSPFTSQSNPENNSLPLTVGLTSVDSEESYQIDSPIPFPNQNSLEIVSVESTPSLSKGILRFLEDLALLENNSTVGSSFRYSSISSHRSSHLFYLESHDFANGSVASAAISKLTLPLGPARTSKVIDSIDRSTSKKSVSEPTSLEATFSKNANPTPTDLDSETTAYFAVFPEGFEGSDTLTITTPILSENFETDDKTQSSKATNRVRQRRGWSSTQNNQWDGTSSFSWEIDDFDPSGSNEAVGTINGGDASDDFGALTTSNKLNLQITANGGIDSLAVYAYGHVGGNAWNDYTGTSGFKFMQGGGGPSDSDFNSNWKNYINLTEPTGMDAWLNGGDPGNNLNSFTWGVHKNGSDYYLTYKFDGDLSLSQAPEPSTYVMTGALVCFIGLNGRSRKASKQLICGVLKKLNFRQSENNSTQLNSVS